MTLPFEFVVDGPAVSQQARRSGLRDEWRERVRSAAEERWPDDTIPVESPVKFSIVNFYDLNEVDVDNIPKLILDALKGLIFIDDSQVTDLTCLKRHVGTAPIVGPPADLMSESTYSGQDFTYVRVEEANVLEVNVYGDDDSRVGGQARPGYSG